jgi:DNA-directed RNA polymerase subunit RPC12/RpoP
VIPATHDPLGLGRLTFPHRWPRTYALLAHAFELSPEQAWSVAWNARRHLALAPERRRVRLRIAAAALLAAPILTILVALPLAEAFIADAMINPDAPTNWALRIAGGLAVIVSVAWTIYERLAEDRLIERGIRRCWRDQTCLWCARDMEGAQAQGDRWAVCPECGMRSPVAARSP